MRWALAVVVTGLVVAGAPGAALADVDAEVGGNVKVKGTIAPEGEVETFTFEAAAGTQVTLKVKADRKSGLDPGISLRNLDTEDGDLGLDDGALSDAGSTVTLKAQVLPTSGHWRLQITGTGTGAYALTLKTKPSKGVSDTFNVSGEEETPFSFSAPRGSLLSLSAKAAKGSGAVPRFTTLTLDGDDPVDISSEGKSGTTSHVVVIGAPGAGGDYTLGVTSDGETSGSISVTVKVKAPKAAKQKLDVRGSALGTSAGGETWIARTLGSGGGSLGAGTGGLLGASLSVPEGALHADTALVLASTEAPPAPTDDDQAAGPAVDLRPSGLLFDSPARLTLPFDPAMVPGNRSAADIRVLIVESNGSSVEVTPDEVDTEAGTVSLPLMGFSVCIPVIRSGVPPLGLRPGGDEYWLLGLQGHVETDQNNDSRARRIVETIGEASFFSDGTLQVSSSRREIFFANAAADGGIETGLQAIEQSEEEETTWSYGSDGRTLLVAEEGDDVVLAASRDGSVLVEHAERIEFPEVELTLLVRKPAAALTAEELTGTWFLGGVETSIDGGGGNGAASIALRREFGTVTLDGKGGAKFSLSSRGADVNGATGAIAQSTGSEKGAATWTQREDGTLLLLSPPDGDGDSGGQSRICPGRGADVMLLLDEEPCGSCTWAAILIRQGSRMSTAALDGTYLGSHMSADLESYAPAPGGSGPTTFVGDPHFSMLDYEVIFDGDTTATLSGDEHHVQRDESEEGGVLTESTPFGTPLTLAVDGKGKITLSPQGQPSALVGAVSPDGMFAFLLSNPANPDSDFGLGMLVKSPPTDD